MSAKQAAWRIIPLFVILVIESVSNRIGFSNIFLVGELTPAATVTSDDPWDDPPSKPEQPWGLLIATLSLFHLFLDQRRISIMVVAATFDRS